MEQVEITFLFWLAIVLGGAASFLYIKNFFAKVEKVYQQRISSALTLISFFSLFLILVFEWLTFRLHPFSGPFMARIFFAFAILAIYLLVELIYSHRSPRIRYIGVFALPISVAILLFAWHSYQQVSSIPPALKSFWVTVHVSCALIAYGSFTIATLMALTYLLQEYRLKSKSLSPFWQKLPSLETADNLCYQFVVVGTIFTGILILSGMVWAKVVWGKMWQWDPKQTGALGMFVIYGFYILSRQFLNWRGRNASYLAILGFIASVITYFISYWLPSIHTYGKGF